MQGSQLLATSILERGCIEYHFNVSLVDQPGTVISRFETLDCLVVMLSRLGQAINRALGSSTFQSLLKVDELLCIGQTVAIMYRDAKLLPEASPVKYIPIEDRDIEFRQLHSLGV